MFWHKIKNGKLNSNTETKRKTKWTVLGSNRHQINPEDFEVINTEGQPMVDSVLINELDESTESNNLTMENQQYEAMLDQIKIAELAVMDTIEDFQPEDLKASDPSEYKNSIKNVSNSHNKFRNLIYSLLLKLSQDVDTD